MVNKKMKKVVVSGAVVGILISAPTWMIVAGL
jgi:hypothetical protein